MPCRSDWMEQTPKEAYLKQTAFLAVFVAGEQGDTIPLKIAEQAEEYNARDVGQTKWLCDTMMQLSDAERDDLIYGDPKNPTNRQLADWWENHVEQDRQRREKEREDARNERLRQSALSKLTDEEKKALRV